MGVERGKGCQPLEAEQTAFASCSYQPCKTVLKVPIIIVERVPTLLSIAGSDSPGCAIVDGASEKGNGAGNVCLNFR